MTTRSRDAEIHAKQEGNDNDLKLTKAPTSSRQWSAFRNPRIVRVSRSFGGKDRHSKVCTVRGLRDRRIRLSVPTAIQLYDLQDRLGLNQPSKVIDWLLDATKHDIDKLPPLQMPQGNFGQFLQPMMASHLQDLSSSYAPFFHPNSSFLKSGWANSMLSTSRESGKINDDEDEQQMSSGKSKYWELDGSRAKGKEVSREFLAEKTKWMNIDEQGTNNSEAIEGYNNNNAPMLSAQQFFPASNQSNSLPGVLMNNSTPYNSSYSYQNWDPSNLSLAQFGSQGLLSSMDQDPHSYGNASSSSLNGSQLFLCPPTMLAPPAMIPAYPSYFTTPVETDVASRQNANSFQHSFTVPPHQQNYQLNVNYPKLFLHSLSNNDESQTNDSASS